MRKLNDILAKSNGETLIEHMTYVLSVFRSIKEGYPDIPKIVGVKDFFEHLFCALFFHDVGKIAEGFQENMATFGYRHEILSACVLNGLPIEEDYKNCILLAILTHHKSFNTLDTKFATDSDEGKKRYDNKVMELEANLNALKEYCDLFEAYQKRYLGYVPYTFELNSPEYWINGFKIAKQYLRLNHIQLWDRSKHLVNSTYSLLLKGFVQICDHIGSANKTEINYAVKDIKKMFNFKEYKCIQKDALESIGHTSLIAPTGFGKTEAALFWSDVNQNMSYARRVFYVLPFTASINAMYTRLKKQLDNYDKDMVTMKHSKVAYYLYNEIEGDTYWNKIKNVQKIKDLSNKMYCPYKICTPFQLIKAFFKVKGFQMIVSEMTQGLFILDEIHAYDARTTALMVGTLTYIKEKLKGTILIMSATLPTFLIKIFKKILGENHHIITVPKKELQQICRHRVEIVEGNIFDTIDLIREQLKDNQRVLVICNTVERAQEVYKELSLVINKQERALLHSRFIVKDRTTIEKELKNKRLLVGTQAIEVSLDISYDVLFTEPAPIDALIQRFGRVNRYGLQNERIAKVHILTQGSKNDKYIYDPELVEKTIQILQKVDMLYEDKIQDLVDQVYGDGFKEKDEEKYWDTLKAFEAIDMMVYEEGQPEDFYKMFDAVEIVPHQFRLDYEECIKEKRYLDALGYTLNITHRQYVRCRDNHQLEKNRHHIFLNAVYDDEIGLQMNEKNSTMWD